MRFYRDILACLLTTLSACMTTSCSDDADSNVTVSQEVDKYITVSIVIDQDDDVTRADAGPTGGEDGDGRQKGSAEENKVNSVTLLLYQSDKGINGPGTETIEYAYYFDQFTTSDNETYESQPISLGMTHDELTTIKTKTYHVIAVCNKDMQFVKGKTLSEARNYIVSDTWTGTPINASSFVMSSEEDATIKFNGETGTGEKNNPFFITSSDNGDQSIQVERLAARIDIDTSNGKAGTVTYNSVDYPCVTFTKEGSTTSYSITNIIPVNIQLGGTYLIKRTDDADPYLAKETKDADGKATNSVIDVFWADKGKGTYYTPSSSEYDSYKFTTVSDDLFLCYTQENTFSSPTVGYKTSYVTGIKFIGYKVVSGVAQPYESTYLIRHSDPTGDALDTAPMKYGIVRNNIYIIKPDAEYVAPEENGLDISIKVKKWNARTHSVIYM